VTEMTGKLFQLFQQSFEDYKWNEAR